jgi:hypothetical protein
MISVPDIRPVIAALKQRLDTDLPASVTAANTETPNRAAAEQPRQILDHIPPIEVLVDFPTIGIGEGPSLLADDTGHASTGVHTLSVMVFDQASDQQALVDQLRALRRAIELTVFTDRVLEDVDDPSRNRAWGTRWIRTEPGPTLGDLNAEQIVAWMSWIRVVIEVRSDSDWA